MLYEVVDPERRAERGPFYDTLSLAMSNAGADLEVYEVETAEPHDRLVCCWPDEEFEPAAKRPTSSEEWRGLARRTATLILAETGVLGPNALDRDGLLSLMSAAWMQGVTYGSNETLEEARKAFERIGTESRR